VVSGCSANRVDVIVSADGIDSFAKVAATISGKQAVAST
jgi:hypothetical protein